MHRHILGLIFLLLGLFVSMVASSRYELSVTDYRQQAVLGDEGAFLSEREPILLLLKLFFDDSTTPSLQGLNPLTLWTFTTFPHLLFGFEENELPRVHVLQHQMVQLGWGSRVMDMTTSRVESAVDTSALYWAPLVVQRNTPKLQHPRTHPRSPPAGSSPSSTPPPPPLTPTQEDEGEMPTTTTPAVDPTAQASDQLVQQVEEYESVFIALFLLLLCGLALWVRHVYRQRRKQRLEASAAPVLSIHTQTEMDDRPTSSSAILHPTPEAAVMLALWQQHTPRFPASFDTSASESEGRFPRHPQKNKTLVSIENL